MCNQHWKREFKDLQNNILKKRCFVFCAGDGKKCCSVCEKVFTSWLPLQDGQSRAARRGICILASSILVLVFAFSSILVLAFVFVLVFLFVFVDQSQGIAGLQKGVPAFWHTPSLLLSLSLFSSLSLLVSHRLHEGVSASWPPPPLSPSIRSLQSFF